MPYPFYQRLSAKGRAIYRQSDAVTKVALPDLGRPRNLAAALVPALEQESRAAVQSGCSALCAQICQSLAIAPVAVRVLATRPHSQQEELHGLYTREEGRVAKIQVWMRTAKKRQVVAFKTFLRTLVHELGHHLDYELLHLQDSYHTEGFFRRESHLVAQLAVQPAQPVRAVPAGNPVAAPRKSPRQLALW